MLICILLCHEASITYKMRAYNTVWHTLCSQNSVNTLRRYLSIHLPPNATVEHAVIKPLELMRCCDSLRSSVKALHQLLPFSHKSVSEVSPWCWVIRSLSQPAFQQKCWNPFLCGPGFAYWSSAVLILEKAFPKRSCVKYHCMLQRLHFP